MNQNFIAKSLAATLIVAGCVAHAEDGARKQMPLVGIVNAQLYSVTDQDKDRCPDPLLPWRIDVTGSAQTNLGAAQFT